MKMTDEQLQQDFDEQLDQVGDVVIFNHPYSMSDALKKTDPVRYRLAYNEWLNDCIENFIVFPHSNGSLHDEPESETV